MSDVASVAYEATHHTMTVDMDEHCKGDVAEWEKHALGKAFTWEQGTYKIVDVWTSEERIEGMRTTKRMFKIQYADSESYGQLSVEDHRTNVRAGIHTPAPQEDVSHLD